MTTATEPLLPLSGDVPISLRLDREPGGGLLYVHAEDAAAFVELLRTMTAPRHTEVLSASTQSVMLSYVGLPGAPAYPDPTWYDMYITEMGWVALVDPATVQSYDVLLYLTDDPMFIASNAGPQGDLAVLAVGPQNVSIHQARRILADAAGVTPPISPAPLPEPPARPTLLELRPELKMMAKEYRGIAPASAAAEVPAWLTGSVWGLLAVTAAAAFYLLYWEPKHG